MRQLLGLLLLVPLLVGCGEEDDRVRLRLWHQKIGAERVFFDEVIARYNAAHPDVVVEPLYRETEELRNLFVVGSVGGQGPEVIYGPADNVGVLALTETILPLDEVLPDSFLARFTDEGVVRWEGEPWMVADQLGNHLVLVYNKDLLPEPPGTTDELVEALQRITVDEDGDGRPDRYGLTWNYREPFFFIPFLTGFGGWVMDEDGTPTLDTEATVRAIRFILDLRDRYEVIPGESDYDVAETLFKEQRAATIINGPWAWAAYGDAGVDYAIAPLPVVSETGRPIASMVSAKGYSVNVNVEEAKLPYVRDLLMHLTGPEIQEAMAEQLASIPTLARVRESDAVQANPELQRSLAAVERGRMMPIAPQMRQVWDGMRGPYQLVMNGAVTPEEGAALMQREVEKRIADTFL
ncbi:MAG: extracellular solute-binding protein [Rhodothermales bacterium]|nr:extracellular solute-binding protein [Rhodothermales bacterium]